MGSRPIWSVGFVWLATALYLGMPPSVVRTVLAADPYQGESAVKEPEPSPQPVEPPAPPQLAGSSPRGFVGIGPDPEEMIQIPAGEFLMGSNDGEEHEKPVHKVHVDAFWIDRHEVTNRSYARFLKATGHRAPGGYVGNWEKPEFNHPDQPVTGVDWEDAAAFCRWAEKRLPTEAEWEKAARGGLEGRKFPWGDADPHGKAAVDWGTGEWGLFRNGKREGAMPVGNFAPNGYGLYDMAGNVMEWCADAYEANYYRSSPSRNPPGPEPRPSGVQGQVDRLVRGGNFRFVPTLLRCASRMALGQRDTTNFTCLGFRCAR